MNTFATIIDLRSQLEADRVDGQRIGFVPTMGYLHDGHMSLIEASVAANERTVVSIFVNPLQFAKDEDFDDYPRDLVADQDRCVEAGVDYLFTPAVAEMYRRPVSTVVSVPEISVPLEGLNRPTHFDGVATVCAKLFSVVGPSRAYFGSKDWQQVAVVTRMVHDLSIPTEIVPCPIVREPDGLAMSSRNIYLTEAERRQAPALRRALGVGIAAIENGERNAVSVEAAMRRVLDADAPNGAVDYVVAVPAESLILDGPLSGEVRLLLAVKFSRARLIDNDGVCAT